MIFLILDDKMRENNKYDMLVQNYIFLKILLSFISFFKLYQPIFRKKITLFLIFFIFLFFHSFNFSIFQSLIFFSLYQIYTWLREKVWECEKEKVERKSTLNNLILKKRERKKIRKMIFLMNYNNKVKPE